MIITDLVLVCAYLWHATHPSAYGVSVLCGIIALIGFWRYFQRPPTYAYLPPRARQLLGIRVCVRVRVRVCACMCVCVCVCVL